MINIETIYPKSDKLLLILKANKESVLEESKDNVLKILFSGNSNNKKILIEFIALEIIDVDNDYKINLKMLDNFKDVSNISNNWLKWSLHLNRDIMDINLVNSGLPLLKQEEMQRLFKHKQSFSKTYNVNLREEMLPTIYYKLFNLLSKEESGTFNKYFDIFNSLPENLLKILETKEIKSLEQLNFYIKVIKENQKENLDTNAIVFLFNIKYEYIERFNKFDLDLITLLNKNILHSDKEIYKLIEYSTKDVELIPLLKGFSKISPNSFLKSIDPRESIEDQISTNGNIFESEDGKLYIDDGEETLRIYKPDEALKKIYNEYLDIKNSPKLNKKDDRLKFELEYFNIPLISGKFKDYSFETYPLLIKDPTSNQEIFNSEVLVRGMIDKDCTSSFKGNDSLGWELIEQLVAYPEDNAYVVVKDNKNNEIASMYVTKVQDSLVIDSIQYMKDLQRLKYSLNHPSEIKEHYHNGLLDTIREWAYNCCNYEDKRIAPKKIYLGEGDDGLRLTYEMREEISIKIKDFGKIGRGKSKEKNFLTDIQTPHTNTIYNDFEGSDSNNNTRLLFTTDVRLLSMKPVYEKIINNLSNLENFIDRKNSIDLDIKTFKKLNKKREDVGLGKYKIQEGVLQDDDSLKDEEIEDEYSNSDLFDRI